MHKTSQFSGTHLGQKKTKEYEKKKEEYEKDLKDQEWKKNYKRSKKNDVKDDKDDKDWREKRVKRVKSMYYPVKVEYSIFQIFTYVKTTKFDNLNNND